MSGERGLRWRGFGWLALCGPWFFLAYGFCNWLTAQRGGVGTFYWAWERRVPFVPALIVPYMSIDLLFVGAFFLPSTREELRVLGTRVFAIITLCCLGFLVWPLRFDWVRPMPTGWTAPLFQMLYANDQPFNLAPSLHIGLRSVLWITYGRHLGGWVRGAARWWFISIGLSTLLVWQHHLIDVITGFLAAYVVIALFPERETMALRSHWLGWRTARTRRLARRYLAGAVLCGAATLPGGGWLWWGWPAIAMAIMGVAYATAHPRWLQKTSGVPTPPVEWILLPVIAAARLRQAPWLRVQPAWHELVPGVFWGRRLSDREARAFLVEHPGLAVIDLTAEAKEANPFRERAAYFPLPVLDLTLPDEEVCAHGVRLIAEQRALGRPVYLHCLLGLGRSAYLAAHWLCASGHCADWAEAIAFVRRIDPRVALPASAREA